MILEELRQEIAILQIEQYDLSRYMKVRRTAAAVKQIVSRARPTKRTKITLILSTGLRVLGLRARYAVLFTSALLNLPKAFYDRYWYLKTRSKLRKLKSYGLRVVVIAGSYGKTSVKHYASQILAGKNVVSTPNSYNTVLGISRVVDLELDSRTDVFLCEIGAYGRGDIAKLCRMVQPDLGILTGITTQHMARFGSLENTIEAKFETAEYIQQTGGSLILNVGDENVRARADEYKTKFTYGSNQSYIATKEFDYKVGVARGKFRINDKEYLVSLPVLGSSNVMNIAGAVALSLAIGIEESQMIDNLGGITPLPHRMEYSHAYGDLQVIDNSYSSNEKSFEESVAFLGKQRTRTRVLVTPGIVELGEKTRTAHLRLGEYLVGKVDLLILVGESDRTTYISEGVGSRIKIVKVDETLDFIGEVSHRKFKKRPLVLIENDVTANYS